MASARIASRFSSGGLACASRLIACPYFVANSSASSTEQCARRQVYSINRSMSGSSARKRASGVMGSVSNADCIAQSTDQRRARHRSAVEQREQFVGDPSWSILCEPWDEAHGGWNMVLLSGGLGVEMVNGRRP